MSDIKILDYGLNNLKSIRKVFEVAGRDTDIVAHGSEINNPDAIILPGIGTFGNGIAELRSREFIPAIESHAKTNKPILGICLGMQLLFTGSNEIEYNTGLNLIPGEVVYFDTSDEIGKQHYSVPQMGWNEIYPYKNSDDGSWDDTLLNQVDQGSDLYFVHSLYPDAENSEDILAVCEYGGQTFPAVVQRGSVVGTQFHPEKSGIVGIEIIQSFCDQFSL
jgi:glutamine amidotransferase